jgi:hypothetical protein
MKISSEIAQERRQSSIQAIANANIPKNAPNRDVILQETLGFLGKFEGLSTAQVKELTLMRQKNGNADPALVDFLKVAAADDLADALENHYSAGGLIVLMNGESLKTAQVAEIA